MKTLKKILVTPWLSLMTSFLLFWFLANMELSGSQYWKDKLKFILFHIKYISKYN